MMTSSLNILIGRQVRPALTMARDAIRRDDQAALSSMLADIFQAMRDDLVLHPSPAWLRDAKDAEDMIAVTCEAIAGELARGLAIHVAPPVLERATMEARLSLGKILTPDERAGMIRTLRNMQEHAQRLDAIGIRLAAFPTLRMLSPSLGQAIVDMVSSRLVDHAALLSLEEPRAIELGTNILLDLMRRTGPSLVGPEDMIAFGIDARLDRRPLLLATRMIETLIHTAAYAFETEILPSRALCARIAAATLRRDAALETRLRARMAALGQIVTRNGKQ